MSERIKHVTLTASVQVRTQKDVQHFRSLGQMKSMGCCCVEPESESRTSKVVHNHNLKGSSAWLKWLANH